MNFNFKIPVSFAFPYSVLYLDDKQFCEDYDFTLNDEMTSKKQEPMKIKVKKIERPSLIANCK